MSKSVDVSIQEIEELLKNKQGNIKNMENMTKSDINKLKKLNEKMDKQQKEIITIMTKLALIEGDLDEVINDTLDMQEIETKIEKVMGELRKMRKSLADIIRNG